MSKNKSPEPSNPPKAKLKQQNGLDIPKVLETLQPNGLLSQHLKGYEMRAQQQQMMRNVLEAYNNEEIALIEAGTGTGKSMAYLIPAMLWALQNNERTVISTNTIALQEQLLLKDIPLATKALNIELKAVLVKGMSNYVCLRKLEDTQHELRLLPLKETNEINQIEKWSQSTRDGSRSGLNFVPSPVTWERVCAETDTCNKSECPYFKSCFFFKARQRAQDAHLLVVNHHLLFCDLAQRMENDPDDSNSNNNNGILPDYSRIIIDESHHLEDVATEHFASHVSRLEVMRTLARLNNERPIQTATDNQESKGENLANGKLPILKEILAKQYRRDPPREVSSLQSRLTLDLPGMRRDLILQTDSTFQSFGNFNQTLNLQAALSGEEDPAQSEKKLRLLPLHKTHPGWSKEIIPKATQLIETIKRYVHSLKALEEDLNLLKNEKLDEQSKGVRYDISALANRLNEAGLTLTDFIAETKSALSVRWIESQTVRAVQNVRLIDAHLDVSEILADYVFKKFATIILCSATLTTNRQFNFIRQRLGLTPELLSKRVITENIYNSPFNFQKQALFAVPTDIPSPLDPTFIPAAAEQIWQLVQASRGNAFVLFTSYSMLNACYQILAKRFSQERYPLLKQGDDNRQSLLQKFKSTDRSVLFGTDSFWEGVDVVGDALRCVIIVKLPFKVPSEPIIQARSEAILARGGDPFSEYSLPNAIVKFKQGVGRLIRNKRDRGCIICLDNRLLNKKYGRQFLNSLPDCQNVFAESAIVQQNMTEFYRKTYYLVAKN